MSREVPRYDGAENAAYLTIGNIIREALSALM